MSFCPCFRLHAPPAHSTGEQREDCGAKLHIFLKAHLLQCFYFYRNRLANTIKIPFFALRQMYDIPKT